VNTILLLAALALPFVILAAVVTALVVFIGNRTAPRK
jgi:lipopolysaccharide export LptBFGC system permease protein LptF